MGLRILRLGPAAAKTYSAARGADPMPSGVLGDMIERKKSSELQLWDGASGHIINLDYGAHFAMASSISAADVCGGGSPTTHHTSAQAKHSTTTHEVAKT